jgi:hypothetical protein
MASSVQVLPPKFCMSFLCLPCCIPHRCRPSRFYHHVKRRVGVKIMKVFIMQFSPASYCFSVSPARLLSLPPVVQRHAIVKLSLKLRYSSRRRLRSRMWVIGLADTRWPLIHWVNVPGWHFEVPITNRTAVKLFIKFEVIEWCSFLKRI